MPLFDYEISDPGGTLSKGRAEAESQAALISRLRAQDRWVLDLQPVARNKRLGPALVIEGLIENVQGTARRWLQGVSLKLLVLFTGQLSTMLGSGLHLSKVLATLGAAATDKRFQKTLHDVGEAITAGATFSSALEQHPHIFDRLYVAVVRAGELSGSLPAVLGTLRVYLEKTARVRRKVLGALTYPAVTLVVVIAIVVIMMVKLVPVFEAVYARANVALPAPTRMILAVSNVLREHALSAVSLVAPLILLSFVAIQSGNILVDTAKLRAPLFGELIRKGILARVCRTLSVLLSGGIPLLHALETAARVSGNKVIERSLVHAIRRLQEGDTISETLRQSGQFPPMVIQLVATGEESGTLAEMLQRAADYYEQEVDDTVATLSTLIEPIMIVAVGAIIGTVIFALYLPIFTLGQAIKGSAH